MKTHRLTVTDLRQFLANLRYFDHQGKITWRRIAPGEYVVTASAALWSNWVISPTPLNTDSTV